MKEDVLVKVRQRDDGETFLLAHKSLTPEQVAILFVHVARKSPEPDMVTLARFVDAVDVRMKGLMQAAANLRQMVADPTSN